MNKPEREDTEVQKQRVISRIDPIIELYQCVHLYLVTKVEKERAELLTKIRNISTAFCMGRWYEVFCAKADIEANPNVKETIAKEIKIENENPLIDELTDEATEKLITQKLRAIFNSTNTKKATEEAQSVIEKSYRSAFKIDVCFMCACYGFFFDKLSIVSQFIDKAEQILESYTDWEQRNRFRVYKGLLLIRSRRYNSAVHFFLASVATFRSSELMSYKTFISITVVFALVTLDRPSLKKNVIENSEISAMIQQTSSVHRLLKAFHECCYADIFNTLQIVTDELSKNAFVARAVPFIAEEIEIRAFNQFLEAYQSVQLTSMANSLGLSTEALETRLFKHISDNRVFCCIDRRNDQVLAQKKRRCS